MNWKLAGAWFGGGLGATLGVGLFGTTEWYGLLFGAAVSALAFGWLHRKESA